MSNVDQYRPNKGSGICQLGDGGERPGLGEGAALDQMGKKEVEPKIMPNLQTSRL